MCLRSGAQGYVPRSEVCAPLKSNTNSFQRSFRKRNPFSKGFLTKTTQSNEFKYIIVNLLLSAVSDVRT